MFNDIHIGPFSIHMYGLMMAIGFLCALKLCLMRGKKSVRAESIILGLFYCALIGGLAGAKLLYIIVDFQEILKKPSILLDIGNGLVVYGGIIGGIIACWIYCRSKKIQFVEYFDLVMPSVSMAQGFGRIGCFFAGCCYGKETELPVGVTFHNSAYAPNGIRLLPTQLISSAGDFLICWILLHYEKKHPKAGCVGALWMLLYSSGRFCIEFLRNDFRGSLGLLSTSQIISVIIFFLGVVTMIKFRRRN